MSLNMTARLLGDYVVNETLGEGGYAQVYAAYHAKSGMEVSHLAWESRV